MVLLVIDSQANKRISISAISRSQHTGAIYCWCPTMPTPIFITKPGQIMILRVVGTRFAVILMTAQFSYIFPINNSSECLCELIKFPQSIPFLTHDDSTICTSLPMNLITDLKLTGFIEKQIVYKLFLPQVLLKAVIMFSCYSKRAFVAVLIQISNKTCTASSPKNVMRPTEGYAPLHTR